MPTVNVSYLRTIPGLLKVGEIVLQVILIICLAVATANFSSLGSVGFAWFTVIVSLIWVVLNLVFFLVGFYDQHPIPSAALVQLIIAAIWVLFHFISGILTAKASADFSSVFTGTSNCPACGNIVGGLGAAAFFHFASMLVFGVDAFLCFMDFRSGPVTTGNAQSSTTTH